mmetsp:Transcript_223/g.877  ORF Transcript_223/g.877 Transcript_223/m.877 type:complete len:95 (-) Transcript_223:249-533(-)
MFLSCWHKHHCKVEKANAHRGLEVRALPLLNASGDLPPSRVNVTEQRRAKDSVGMNGAFDQEARDGEQPRRVASPTEDTAQQRTCDVRGLRQRR